MTLTNPLADLDFPGATVTDDLTDVLKDATYVGATSQGAPKPPDPVFTSPNLTWGGDVPAGRTITLTYSVKIKDPNPGDWSLRNTVVGPANSTAPPVRPTRSAAPSSTSPTWSSTRWPTGPRSNRAGWSPTRSP
ncbi:hypothetical protein ACFQX7_19685 [Luedemannella flava]